MKLRTLIAATAATVLAGTALVTAAVSGGALSSLRSRGITSLAETDFPDPNTTVQAVMVSNEHWSATPTQAGIYNIDVRQGAQPVPVHCSEGYADICAALFKDETLYAVEASLNGFYYRTINTGNWATVGSRQEIDLVNVPCCLAWDPVTAKAYGGFFSEEDNGFYRFSTFGLSDAEARDINLQDRQIHCLAITPEGVIYALRGDYNVLATLNPRNGDYTRINATGFDIDTNINQGWISSMTWDEENQRLIALVFTREGPYRQEENFTRLYVIDPVSGAVTTVSEIPGAPGFTGLHVIEGATPVEAPAAPTDLKVDFLTPTSLQGKVSFKAPVLSAGGAALSGQLKARVTINGRVAVTLGGITPGSVVTTDALDFDNGENDVRVVMATTELRGDKASVNVYAGEDIPGAVLEPSLSISPEGWAQISWKAPAEGLNGGNIDPATLKYSVKRVQDGKLVAENLSETSFTDKSLDADVLRSVSYAVTASNASGTSPEAVTNTCLSAGALAIPFSETFETADDFALWTTVNVGNTSSWVWYKDKEARYEYDHDKLKADNWLISPALRMEAGNVYKLSYSWRVLMKNYPESFEVCYGSSPDPASMTVLATHSKVNNTKYESASVVVNPAEGDVHYVAIHATSDAYMYILAVDNILVEELDSRVPGAVEDFVVTPAEKGGMSATVSFKAPSLDSEGKTLHDIDLIVVKRQGLDEPVATFVSPIPGEALSCEDKNFSAAGFYTYEIVSTNEVGESVPVTARAYVGIDAPGAVGNLVISELDHHPHLSWTAPSEGANGGWFNAASVTYRIVRSDGVVVEETHTGCEYTDESYTSPTKGQDALYYLVTPYGGSLKGTYERTETMLFGVPYVAPLTETFPQAELQNYPWLFQSSTAVNYAWTTDNMGYTPQTADQNGDRGLATFHSVGEPVGSKAYFYSPMVDISGLKHPVLSFWMYHTTTEGDESLELLVAPGTDSFESTGSEWKRQASENGWQRHTLDLSRWASAPWVRVGFCGTGYGVEDVYVDNISISSLLATDAAVSAFTLPARVGQGIDVNATVTIANLGISALEGLNVTVTDSSGREYCRAALAQLLPDCEESVVVQLAGLPLGKLTLKATVTAAGDEDTENNSATAQINVVTPVLPTVSELTGVVGLQGSVMLTWQDPTQRGEVTDNFESYKDWAIDGVGEWTMWDGDYDITYMISYTYGEYENCTARKAFQVLNADKMGINIWPQGTPHSGDKMMAAMASYNYVNNDWMISPELNGSEQWISFWARSFTLDNTPAERMKVWLSTESADPASFTEITPAFIELPDRWVEYRYLMPEGTRYFAINCVSDGAFALFVDDATFNDLTVPAWELAGYEVYRDGEFLAETPGPEYTDHRPEGDNHEYTVRPVYSNGERGRFCEALRIVTSGIEEAESEDAAPVDVCNLQGIVLRRGVQASEALKDLPAGTYIVGNRKVQVR